MFKFESTNHPVNQLEISIHPYVDSESIQSHSISRWEWMSVWVLYEWHKQYDLCGNNYQIDRNLNFIINIHDCICQIITIFNISHSHLLFIHRIEIDEDILKANLSKSAVLQALQEEEMQNQHKSGKWLMWIDIICVTRLSTGICENLVCQIDFYRILRLRREYVEGCFWTHVELF